MIRRTPTLLSSLSVLIVCLSRLTALMTSPIGFLRMVRCWTHLRLRQWYSEQHPDCEVWTLPEVLRWLAPASSFRTQLSFLVLSSTRHFLWTGMYPASSVPATFISASAHCATSVCTSLPTAARLVGSPVTSSTANNGFASFMAQMSAAFSLFGVRVTWRLRLSKKENRQASNSSDFSLITVGRSNYHCRLTL